VKKISLYDVLRVEGEQSWIWRGRETERERTGSRLGSEGFRKGGTRGEGWE